MFKLFVRRSRILPGGEVERADLPVGEFPTLADCAVERIKCKAATSSHVVGPNGQKYVEDWQDDPADSDYSILSYSAAPTLFED